MQHLLIPLSYFCAEEPAGLFVVLQNSERSVTRGEAVEAWSILDAQCVQREARYSRSSLSSNSRNGSLQIAALVRQQHERSRQRDVERSVLRVLLKFASQARF